MSRLKRKRINYPYQFLNGESYNLTVGDFLNILRGEQIESQIVKWDGYQPEEYDCITGINQLTFFLEISEYRARQLIAEGKIPAVKKGNTYLFDTAKVREYARNNPYRM